MTSYQMMNITQEWVFSCERLFLTCRDKEYTRAEDNVVARLVELTGSYTHASEK